MTTPASGPISLANVQAEFGGTNPISLSEYYSGGAYVTAGTTGGNGSNGISALTVIPTSAKISLANFYSASAVPKQMVIGARTILYASGTTFDYYDPAVISQTPADVNITVSQDITATLALTGGAGMSTTASTGAYGGMGHTVNFTFLFKAGVTYVLALGGPGQAGNGGGGVGGAGGGYSGLFLGSKSFSNTIAIAGGGGGGGSWTGGLGGDGGSAGTSTTTAPTGGIAWTAYPGNPNSGTTGGGQPGTGAAAGGASTGTNPGSAGGQLTGGTGGVSGTTSYGGGGGAGYYGGGGGAGGSSGSGTAGGGGGASFVYTTSDASGKTSTSVSAITSSGSTSWTQNTGRALNGLAGQDGNRGTGTVTMTTWSGFGNWRRPYPGGSLAGTVSYDLVLASDLTAGSSTVSVAFSVVTSASSLSSSSVLTLGADARRIAGGTQVVEFTISGTTYTKTISSVSTTAITLTATLGVAVPSGQTILIYPVNSATAATVGALNVTTGLPTTAIFRIAEPGGTYVYGKWANNAAGITGGTSTPIVATLAAPLYPAATLAKGSIIQRSANSAADAGASYGIASISGGSCGAVRITFA